MITGETENIVADYLDSDAYDAFLFGRRRKIRRRRSSSIARKSQRGVLRGQRRRTRNLRRTNRINKRIVRRNSPKVIQRKARTRRIVSQVKRLAPTVLPLVSGSTISSISTPPFTSTADSNMSSSNTPITGLKTTQKDPSKENNIPKVVYIVGGLALLGIVGAIVVSTRNTQVAQPQF